jgi:hypothetical protein
MVLMVRDGHDTDFFVLSRGSREGQYFYSLRPWLRGEAANIEIDASDVSRMTLNVVTCGVPMPRHGSLLGWSWLDDLIAGTPGTVFWINTKAVLGSDCCAVARDITSPEGHTLRRGRYVYYEALQAGKPVPPLRKLLAAADRTDLASRFHRPESADACA